MKRLFAAVLSLGLAGGIAAAQETENKPAKREPRATATKSQLEKYDTNKNGVIDKEERAAVKKDRQEANKEQLKKYDKNGDGKLDESERSAMREDAKNRRPKKDADGETKKTEPGKKAASDKKPAASSNKDK